MEHSLPARKKQYDVLLRRVRDLPSLPDVVNKIMEILVQPNANASEVAKLVTYDPGLTSKVLRMVNSAAYGFQRQISSVQHAIMILGFGTVRGVVLSASIFDLFEGKKGDEGIDPTEFWKHSLNTAVAAKLLAEKWKIPYADDAFSAGMLHDIGKMVLDYYCHKEYAKVLEDAWRCQMPYHGSNFLELEQHILKIDHAEIGYQVAIKWKMPAAFVDVIRYHHAPQQATNAPQLVYIVALANAFSHINVLNYGVFDMDYIPKEVLEFFDYDEETGDPAAFKKLYKEVAKQMEGVDDLLRSLHRPGNR